MNAKAIDGIPNADYHAMPSVSNSMLGDALESMELFHARYIARTMPRKKTTDAMAFGTLVHDAVLLGIENTAVVCPDEVLDKRGYRTGKAFEEFAAANAGKSLLKRDGDYGYANLRSTVEAILSHPTAKKLLDKKDAAIEQSILWTDEPTGLECRCRPDIRQKGWFSLIADIKTTTDIGRRAVATKIHDFGYDRQCAFYRNGVYELTGEWLHFVFIFAEVTPPFRVRCYDLDDRDGHAMQKGFEDMRAALDKIAAAKESGVWTDAGWDEILTIDLPNWAYRQNEWELT